MCKSANDKSLARDEGGDCNRRLQDTRASIAHDAGDGNICFPVCGCSYAQDSRAPKGDTGELTISKLQEYHKTSFVSDQQT